MSQTKETLVLVLSILITGGLVGGGFWWFTQRSSNDLGGILNQQTNPARPVDADTFARSQNVPTGLFNYGGSTIWAPIRKEIDPAIQTVWPQFRLRYTQPNSVPSTEMGIRMLLDNQLDFAQSSRGLTDNEFKQAQQRGFQLKEIPVGIDGIAIAVNPSLNLPGLTVEQFNDIYAGKITNWSQVGGPYLAIAPYGKKDRDSGEHIKFIATTTEALREVAANPGGIYYSSAPLIVPQCNVKSLPLGNNLNQLVPPYKEPFVPLAECPQRRNQLNLEAFQSGQYPLSRRLFVIVKQNGQIAEQAGDAYARLLLTNQGQELLEKAGFVRIR